MPSRRARPRPAPEATPGAIAAILTAKGWTPARTNGRLITVEDTAPADEGDFLLHSEPADTEQTPATVLLWCLTDTYVSTLAAMAGALQDEGYTVEDTDDFDGVRVRFATSAELTARALAARDRVAPLLDLLAPAPTAPPETTLF